jgi:ComF family protein
MTHGVPNHPSPLKLLAHLGSAALRFLFPPVCPLCHAETKWTVRDVQGRAVVPVLCAECSGAVRPPAGNRCGRCGLPVGPFVKTDDGCWHCRRQDFRFDRVIRLGLYDDAMRDACIRAKAPMQSPLAAALANLLWLTERADLESIAADVVVPVPRYWAQRVARKHHSAETIARVLAKRLSCPFSRTLLRKVRWTPDQSDLPRVLRRDNLKDAFRAWPSWRSLAGRTVLLVDDILTTGTTAHECARALRKAGATRVIAAVLAVVPASSR